MRVIYVDSLFLLNLVVNYLLLLATAKIGAVHISRWRIAVGAAFGALYAVAAVFPQFGFLLTAPMRLVSGGAMVLIVFGGGRGILRLGLVFFAVSAAFGGMIYAISLALGGPAYDGQHVLPISLKVLLIAFGLCYGIMTLVFSRLGRDTGGKLRAVEITRGGRTASLMGLSDTGNSLTDPITGGAVLVVETAVLGPLFTPETAKLLLEAETETAVALFTRLQDTPDGRGLYLIPYTAVGTGSGFLLGFRPERLLIDGKEKKGAGVALSPTRLSDGGRYAALIPAGH
ncbi:MAG: sigma-E processing peptidase SpoIIGA [Oscillospiraceae bacterium]|nr:sigma-E processing peptidase SpoIIGA [Oscillospiraceae bacterium]